VPLLRQGDTSRAISRPTSRDINDVRQPRGGRRVPAADLDLVGLALHAPKNTVDCILKGARLHP
jgi:hypothetical protein